MGKKGAKRKKGRAARRSDDGESTRISRYVDVHIKRELLAEAGGKCANPGCPTSRIEYHHIDAWVVVQTHDMSRMIAICPTCHSSVHGGQLRILASTLRKWKTIIRNNALRVGHLYVEPDTSHVIVLGSIGFTGTHFPVRIFPDSNTCQLSYSLINGSTLCLNARIVLRGLEALKVELGYALVSQSDLVEFRQRPGHIQVMMNMKTHGVPPLRVCQVYARIALMELVQYDNLFNADERDVIVRMDPDELANPDYVLDSQAHQVLARIAQLQRELLDKSERLIVFEAEVERPGQVRLRGVWEDDDGNLVIATRHALYLCPLSTGIIQPLISDPIGLGERPQTVMRYTGKDSLFGFVSRGFGSAGMPKR
jgi:hypothetical protein